MPFCPECGAEVEAEDTHCYNCGRNLEGGHAASGTHDERDDQWGSAWNEGTDQETTPGRADHDAQDRHVGGPAPEPDGRRIEDGKVEYTMYFPITRDYEPLLLGALCSFLGFLLVPLFTLYGYAYRLTAAAARGETVQPVFEDWVELTKQGFFYFLVYLLFGLLAALAVGGPVALGVTMDSPAIAGFLALVSGLVVSYVAPAVLVLYPATGSVSDAFSPSNISAFAFTSAYFVSYLVFIALAFAFLVLVILGSIVLVITILGIFVLFPLSYVVQAYIPYAMAAYWGATYYEAAQEGQVPPAGDEPVTDDTEHWEGSSGWEDAEQEW